MKFEKTRLGGVVKVIPTVHSDARGFFMETWQAEPFREGGIDATFVQENLSRSSRGTLLGLHYQVQETQGKLVRVVSGEVFDVAVDLRKSSPRFGQWVGEFLSGENRYQLWVPPGFAHGFLMLSDMAVFEYKCTDFYTPEFERAVRWDNPDIGIERPLPVGEIPTLSAKVAAAPLLKDAETFA